MYNCHIRRLWRLAHTTRAKLREVGRCSYWAAPYPSRNSAVKLTPRDTPEGEAPERRGPRGRLTQ